MVFPSRRLREVLGESAASILSDTSVYTVLEGDGLCRRVEKNFTAEDAKVAPRFAEESFHHPLTRVGVGLKQMLDLSCGISEECRLDSFPRLPGVDPEESEDAEIPD
jgi:hypothetical protein